MTGRYDPRLLKWEAVKSTTDRRRTVYWRLPSDDTPRGTGNVARAEGGLWRANGWGIGRHPGRTDLGDTFATRKEAEAAVLAYLESLVQIGDKVDFEIGRERVTGHVYHLGVEGGMPIVDFTESNRDGVLGRPRWAFLDQVRVVERAGVFL